MNLTKVFQYSIYPLLMLTTSTVLIGGIERGYNPYWVSLPVIAFTGLLILCLEKLLPYEKQWLNAWDWNLDLTYYIINYLIKVLAQYQFLYLAEWINIPVLFPVSWPFWLQVLLALTIIDFFLFFIHKISHRFTWLWKFHAIHHSSERLYFLNGEKRHALHQIVEGAPGILVCLLIGTPQPAVVAALSILAINMFMQHTNLDYKAGVLKKFFCVAELHRWHHRADYHDAQVNFGAWLTIWDHLFGTAFDDPRMALEIGEIGIKEEPDFPKTYWNQLFYPFRK